VDETVRHAARMGRTRYSYNILTETVSYGKIILKWTFKKYDVRTRTGFTWFRAGKSGGLL
jgi:hypothetical protein